MQEVTEFRGFAADARDPRTGERLGDRLDRIFDAFLARDIPDESEATFTFLDGRPYRSNADLDTSRELLDAVRSLGDVQAVRRGDVASPEGRVRYLAVPVRATARVRGAFVVTSARRAGGGGGRPRPCRSPRASRSPCCCSPPCSRWVLAGRVLAPLRDARRHRALDRVQRDLTQRIEVDGNDEIAELGRTFNAMLDRLEAGVRAASASSSPTRATSCARRSRSSAATSSCWATTPRSAARRSPSSRTSWTAWAASSTTC